MTPGEHHALTKLVRGTLARARGTARRSAEIQATVAELTVIAAVPTAAIRGMRQAGRRV